MSVRRIPFRKAGVTPLTSNTPIVGVSSTTLSFTLHPPPAAPALLARAVVREGRDVLDAADAHARAGQSPDRGLRAGAGRLALVAARSADLHVERVDALLAHGVRDALGGLHRGVGRGFVLRGADDHAARALRDRLGAGEVRDGHEDVVERRVDVDDCPASHYCSPSFGVSFAASLGGAAAGGAAPGAARGGPRGPPRGGPRPKPPPGPPRPPPKPPRPPKGPPGASPRAMRCSRPPPAFGPRPRPAGL